MGFDAGMQMPRNSASLSGEAWLGQRATQLAKTGAPGLLPLECCQQRRSDLQGRFALQQGAAAFSCG